MSFIYNFKKAELIRHAKTNVWKHIEKKMGLEVEGGRNQDTLISFYVSILENQATRVVHKLKFIALRSGLCFYIR